MRYIWHKKASWLFFITQSLQIIPSASLAPFAVLFLITAECAEHAKDSAIACISASNTNYWIASISSLLRPVIFSIKVVSQLACFISRTVSWAFWWDPSARPRDLPPSLPRSRPLSKLSSHGKGGMGERKREEHIVPMILLGNREAEHSRAWYVQFPLWEITDIIDR